MKLRRPRKRWIVAMFPYHGMPPEATRLAHALAADEKYAEPRFWTKKGATEYARRMQCLPIGGLVQYRVRQEKR